MISGCIKGTASGTNYCHYIFIAVLSYCATKNVR